MPTLKYWVSLRDLLHDSWQLVACVVISCDRDQNILLNNCAIKICEPGALQFKMRKIAIEFRCSEQIWYAFWVLMHSHSIIKSSSLNVVRWSPPILTPYKHSRLLEYNRVQSISIKYSNFQVWKCWNTVSLKNSACSETGIFCCFAH